MEDCTFCFITSRCWSRGDDPQRIQSLRPWRERCAKERLVSDSALITPPQFEVCKLTSRSILWAVTQSSLSCLSASFIPSNLNNCRVALAPHISSRCKQASSSHEVFFLFSLFSVTQMLTTQADRFSPEEVQSSPFTLIIIIMCDFLFCAWGADPNAKSD